MAAVRNCFMLLAQEVRRAASRARLRAGSSIAAKIAMMAITTSNSMSVNAPEVGRRQQNL